MPRNFGLIILGEIKYRVHFILPNDRESKERTLLVANMPGGYKYSCIIPNNEEMIKSVLSSQLLQYKFLNEKEHDISKIASIYESADAFLIP
jgi:hypothetical protein